MEKERKRKRKGTLTKGREELGFPKLFLPTPCQKPPPARGYQDPRPQASQEGSHRTQNGRQWLLRVGM
jgi:hypothetical protein